MMRGVRFHHVGFAVLLVLAGCGRSIVTMGEREPWRQQAEATCLQSGAVKEGAGIVRIAPIEGPGMCGAEYPLKVAALGENRAMGFMEELRPPGSVPTGSQFPIAPPRSVPAAPRYAPAPQHSAPPQYAPPPDVLSGPPISLEPPGVASAPVTRGYQLPIDRPETVAPANTPRYEPRYEPRDFAPRYAPPRADDIPDDAKLPSRQAYPAPQQREQPREVPRLGPMRGPMVTGAIKTAISPPATLACPIVSALDKWILESVQPAAMRWFRQPVVEIKQISAYSCRGMVGNGSAHISEHAFGNALDIAAFVLADGRKVTVKNGWDGTPEETGFLHDVQLAACERFTTVLGPGYNVYHYDHIHVDLIRRRSGRSACRPNAIPGEVAAARQLQKTRYARRGEQLTTGSVGPKSAKRAQAIVGQDGFVEDEDDEASVTGSIGNVKGRQKTAVPGEDGFFEDE